jgi:hypothetical protein
MNNRQTFEVHMHNCSTGERRIVRVDAFNPVAALSLVLRRRGWAEALLSERPHKFIVTDISAVW